jgi:hypothetical protein
MANQLFIQNKVVKINNNITLNSPPFYIDFANKFDTESDSNTGSIEIFNLSSQTIKKITKEENLLLKAGYENDVGVITKSDIVEVKTRWESKNKITEIVVSESSKEWLNKKINRTWKKNIKVERVAKDIIDNLDISIGKIDIPNKRYAKGKTFSTTCKKALEEIANDFDLKLHVSKGNIYLLNPEKSAEKIINISPNNGLIKSPELNNGNYKAKMLLNYRISPDIILNFKDTKVTGKFRVINGEHIASGNDFKTEVVMEKYE